MPAWGYRGARAARVMGVPSPSCSTNDSVALQNDGVALVALVFFVALVAFEEKSVYPWHVPGMRSMFWAFFFFFFFFFSSCRSPG